MHPVNRKCWKLNVRSDSRTYSALVTLGSVIPVLWLNSRQREAEAGSRSGADITEAVQLLNELKTPLLTPVSCLDSMALAEKTSESTSSISVKREMPLHTGTHGAQGHDSSISST